MFTDIAKILQKKLPVKSKFWQIRGDLLAVDGGAEVAGAGGVLVPAELAALRAVRRRRQRLRPTHKNPGLQSLAFSPSADAKQSSATVSHECSFIRS